MKKMNRHKTHSLYHFLLDNSPEIIRQRMRTSTNRAHPALYISLPCVDIKHKNWKMTEQHITIEKHINPELDFLSPSHFTLCFEHKTDADIACKIHVYFDTAANFNGTILKTALTSDLEPIDLADEDIRVLAQTGQQILFELLQLKANKFIEIVQEMDTIDQALQTHMQDLNRVKSNTKKKKTLQTITKDFITLLEQHERYRDDDIRDNWDYLLHLSDALKSLERPRLTRAPAQSEKSTSEKSSIELKAPLSEAPQRQALVSTEKEAIHDLLEKVTLATISNKDEFKLGEMMTVTDITLLAQYANHLDELNQALTIYDLTHDDEAFVAEIKNRLPKNVPNLASFFYERALGGDLETIQTLYENTTIKINLTDLFEQILSAIEKQPANGEHLIPIANYFYEHSELYRAYVLFRLKYSLVEIPMSIQAVRILTSLPKTFNSNLLAKMFIIDNRSAFALYLRHGLSPLGCHSWCGQAGFNALQTILLLSVYCQTNPEPYVQLLFEHGAVQYTPKITLGKTYASIALRHDHPSDSSTAPITAIFDSMHQRSKKSAVSVTRKSSTTGISKDQQELIDVLFRQEHILPFAWRLVSDRTPSLLNMIIRHCDMHPCLIELNQILIQAFFLVCLLPSKQGGCFFYPSAQDFEKECRKMAKIENSPDHGVLSFLGLFAQRALQPDAVLTHPHTIAIHIWPDPAYTSESDLVTIQQSTSSAKIIFEAFKSLYDKASPDMRSTLIQSMRKQALDATLKKDWQQASSYLQAGILALSLHPVMDINDYKLLFPMSIQYAKCVDNIRSAHCCNGTVMRDISVNLHSLFSKLSRAIQNELEHLPAVQEMLMISSEYTRGLEPTRK